MIGITITTMYNNCNSIMIFLAKKDFNHSNHSALIIQITQLNSTQQIQSNQLPSHAEIQYII